MSTSSPLSLEEAIRDAGEGWLLDNYHPPGEAMPHIHRTLEAVHREAQSRIGQEAPCITEEALAEEYLRNPLRVKGFFQALSGTRTPEMLLMVWRIIQGMEVSEIQMKYRRQDSFELRVVLQSPYGEKDPPYVSQNIHDFALFRHIGIMQIGNAPVFDGYYPLRVQ